MATVTARNNHRDTEYSATYGNLDWYQTMNAVIERIWTPTSRRTDPSSGSVEFLVEQAWLQSFGLPNVPICFESTGGDINTIVAEEY